MSNAKVSTTGSIENVKDAKTHNELVQLIQSQKGWKRSLAQNDAGVAERSISAIALLGGTLFATAVTPCAAGQCNDASSRLYCLDYKTGTANVHFPACGISSETPAFLAPGIAEDVIDLGAGISASPSLHLDQRAPDTGSVSHSGSNNALTVITQSSTGAITQTTTQTNALVRSGEIDWREIRQ